MTSSGVSRTLTQNADGSYNGNLANIDLPGFYNSVKANPLYSKWAWDTFNGGKPPSSNAVYVKIFSRDDLTQVPATVGEVATIGIVESTVFNVGTVDNYQCTNKNPDGTYPVGMSVKLYSAGQ